MLIKKITVFIILITFSAFRVSSVDYPQLSAHSAVVVDCNTNTVIYQKNSAQILSMASTTKIMTSILAIESGKLNCTVTAKQDINCDGTSIGIKKGDSFALETLVWAMMLESGNDAAVLTANYLAGSEKDFAELMNYKAAEIGMKNTNFVTASGLDDDEHYTTAYDMAILASYAVKNPIFRNICSTSTKRVDYISPDVSVTYSNHNKLLNMCDGVFGIKTGFTKKSGRCLVSACERNGITLVAVTLKAPDDWNDHIKLYDYCFEKSSLYELDAQIPSKIKVYGGTDMQLELNIEQVFFNNFNNSSVTYEVVLPEFIYAPVEVNDEIGYIRVYVDAENIVEYPITADKNIKSVDYKQEPSYTFMYKLKYFLSEIF